MERSVVGDLINFRGMVYSPVSEQGVVFLFGKVLEDLNMYVEEVKDSFPDCVARRFTGKGWEKVNIEFEFKSSKFVEHEHPVDRCDIIVCWEHDWEGCPLEVIELREVIKTLENRPVSRPDTPEKPEFNIEHHYKRKNMTPEAVKLYEQFDTGLKQIDERIWRKIARTAVSYYCPERVFCYVNFRKQGFNLDIFTGGNEIEGVTKYGGDYPKWGELKVRTKSDLISTLTALSKSFEYIREAIRNNEPTGWFAKLEEEMIEEAGIEAHAG